MKHYLANALLALTVALCTASCAENILMSEEIPSLAARVTVTAPNILTDTRAAYSGYSLSFESGDKIGVYVLCKNLLDANVCFTYNGTAWVPDQEIEYSDDYTYYAYYPYVADAYAPDFAQAEIDNMFAEYITDEENKFQKADQSVKANFNASDLMIGEGIPDGNGTVAFTLDHKKGLAVFTGSYADGIFSGDNIPYTVGTKGYYLMKADVPYSFTDATDDTYLLYASRGKYTTHEIPKQYLTFIALEDGTFSFSKAGLSYSLDDGETWTALYAGANTPTVTAGSKIMWKNNTTLTPIYSDGIGTFSSTGTFEAEGNIMSLYYGDNAIGMKSLTIYYSLQNLFKNSKIVNAQRLLLPATNISTGSYWGMFENCTSLILPPAIIPIVEMAQEGCRSMFYGCTSLTTPPILPATKMVSDCYNGMFYGCKSLTTAPELPATYVGMRAYSAMFYGCKSLTTAPELPATSISRSCYQSMFSNCTSLTTAPELPATTLAESCYQGMFYGCTSLTTAPALPATTLSGSCYQYMFQGCTALTTAPELPATILSGSCYQSMFYGCSSLTTVPELPATSLTSNCYASMFSGCTSLTTAPELPATTLESSCYAAMFFNCSSLNYVKAAFTTTPSSTYTSSWLEGVAATGTFYKNSAATWDVTGQSGIPSGWTVVTYTP